MAEAHGKLNSRPGVCFVTRGPGATNASIGVHTAFQDSTPMVLFVGDVASDQRDREAFQEVNYESFFGPSTKGMKFARSSTSMPPCWQKPLYWPALERTWVTPSACAVTWTEGVMSGRYSSIQPLKSASP